MPIPLFWLAVLAGGSFLYYGRKRAGHYLLAAAFLWLALTSTSLVPNLFVRSLENRYAPFSKPPAFQADSLIHILVLGGGHTSDARLSPNGRLSPVALGRLVEAIRIYRHIPAARLVLSGHAGQEAESQAEVLAATASLMGVPENAMSRLNEPHNTRAEARAYRQAFGKRHPPLILVTDAIHMPRAMMLFRMEGLSPVPAPTNYLLKSSSGKKKAGFWPSDGNLLKSRRVIHECAGMIWAKFNT